MRSSRELLLATREFAHEQRWRSWWHVWSTLAALSVLLVISAADWPWYVRLPSSVVAGLVLVRCFILYHDQQHGAILKGSRLGGVMMWLFGLLALNPNSVWQRSHDHHHRHNSKGYNPNIGSFPLMTVADYQAASFWQRLSYGLTRHPLTMILGYFTVFAISMCLQPLLRNPRRHYDAALSLAAHLGLCWLMIHNWGDLIFAWLIPCMVSSALGSYLFFAQHNFPGVRLQTEGGWDYVDSALHASSYMAMGPLMSWFTGNIGYHHIHHLNAKIPFYRLPEAMAAIEETQQPTTITLSLADTWTCLSLKLWDTEAKQLVAWPVAKNQGADILVNRPPINRETRRQTAGSASAPSRTRKAA